MKIEPAYTLWLIRDSDGARWGFTLPTWAWGSLVVLVIALTLFLVMYVREARIG